jgi:hypothetical protein
MIRVYIIYNSNVENFEKGKCSCSAQYGCSSMGYYANLNKEEGDFFLDTNNGNAASLCKN